MDKRLKISECGKAIIGVNDKNINHITIPNGITTIYENAFWGCKFLQSVEIPNSVTTIMDNAFRGCSLLQSIDIPCSVTTIGKRAFMDCSELKSIDIPNSITKIEAYTFEGCSALQKIVIPNSVKDIGGYAFYNNTTLKSIKLPNGLTKIRSGAFDGCSSLKNISIPDSVKTIGRWSFRSCSSLETINIPSKVNWIGSCAFSECLALEYIDVAKENQVFTSINGFLFDKKITKIIRVPMGIKSYSFPNSINTIGEYAFEGCYALQSIGIPSNITTIEECAFNKCTALKNIDVSINNPNYSSLDGVLYDKDLKIIIRFPCNKNIAEYNIPSSVTMVGNYAFENNSALKSICIPDSINKIGYNAFSKCISLQHIYLQCTKIEDVSISESAFDNINTDDCILHAPTEKHWAYRLHPIFCKFKNINGSFDRVKTTPRNDIFKLTKDCKTIIEAIDKNITHITIPNNITIIRKFAFKLCSSLQSIDIPNSVSTIEIGAFLVFSATLQNINVSNSNKHYSSIDGILFNKDLTNIVTFPVGKKVEKYKIPYGVTTIETGAFYGNKYLKDVDIPNSVTEIKSSAFCYLNSLQNLHIHITDIENTEIKNNAFEVNTDNCILHIPPGTRWAYRHHPIFSKFKNIEIEDQD